MGTLLSALRLLLIRQRCWCCARIMRLWRWVVLFLLVGLGSLGTRGFSPDHFYVEAAAVLAGRVDRLEVVQVD